MLKFAVVGGGLCGLALASGFARRGDDFALFEARDRLGGRVLTKTSAEGLAMDLGATWFWPRSQPLLQRLVAELKLADFPQFEERDALELRDPDAAPERVARRGLYEGARRIEGGMGALVEALAATLPRRVVHVGHVLEHVEDRGDRVQLRLRVGNGTRELETRHLVLAMPPRLAAERVRFEPELDHATREAMRDTPTWMAARAKAVAGFARATWREAGLSGAAFVTHPLAVFSEIFDACDAKGGKAALGAFLALSPDQRADFADGLPMLMESQCVQVFGGKPGPGEFHIQDWAREPRSCAALDRDSPPRERAEGGNPLLRRTLWNGKLHLGGSETAARDAGLLEGALETAGRIERALAAGATRDAAIDGLAGFEGWVAAQVEPTFDNYRARLDRALQAQRIDQLTQLAILGAMEDLFASALTRLDAIAWDGADATVEKGRSSLTPLAQRPFGPLMRAVIDDVVAFNRASCALSNFPSEHRPSEDYMRVILNDIAAAWRDFSLAANRRLVERTATRRREAIRS